MSGGGVMPLHCRSRALPPHRPPGYTIRLEYEATAPKLWSDAVNDAEAARLDAWIEAHPDLAALVDTAAELADEHRRTE